VLDAGASRAHGSGVLPLATAMLLMAAAAPGPGHAAPGSFRVSVRVAAPLRASAPALVDLGAGGAALSRDPGGGWVARVPAPAAARGAPAAVLAGVLGEVARACDPAAGTCEVALGRAGDAPPARSTVVMAFLPDAAAATVVQR